MFASVAALVCGGTLLVTGSWHATHRTEFVQVLHSHKVWASSMVPAAAILVSVMEVVTGALTLLWLVGDKLALEGALWGAGGLFAAFTAYLACLARWRTGVRCGCQGREGWVTWVTVLRSGLLAAFAAAGTLGARSLPADPPVVVNMVATLAALGLAVLLWSLPAALSSPAAAAAHSDPSYPSRA